LKLYITNDNELFQADKLNDDDWDNLRAIYFGLKPFSDTTLRLEGHGNGGSHGFIWEVLPSFDLLLSHVETKIVELKDLAVALRPTRGPRRQQEQEEPQLNPMLVAYQNAWDILSKYNNITDSNHEIYAAATFLNPCLRMRYFDRAWTGNGAEAQKELMLEKNRGIWEAQYRQNTTIRASHIPPRSSLSAHLFDLCADDDEQQDSDFKRYLLGKPSPWIEWQYKDQPDLFQWWARCEYPDLRQWAFDTLSIPAMSAELERVFSQAKRFFPTDRNRLSTEAFEAMMLLKQWSLQGIYSVVPSGPLSPEDISEPIR
jgi:hypothetical protein